MSLGITKNRDDAHIVPVLSLDLDRPREINQNGLRKRKDDRLNGLLFRGASKRVSKGEDI